MIMSGNLQKGGVVHVKIPTANTRQLFEKSSIYSTLITTLASIFMIKLKENPGANALTKQKTFIVIGNNIPIISCYVSN